MTNLNPEILKGCRRSLTRIISVAGREIQCRGDCFWMRLLHKRRPAACWPHPQGVAGWCGGWAQQVGGLKSIRGITSLPALLCQRRLSALRWNAEGPPLKPDPAPSPGRARSRGRSLPLGSFSWKGVQVVRHGVGVGGGGLEGPVGVVGVVPYWGTGYFRVAAVRCRGRVRLRNAVGIFFHTYNPLLHTAHPPRRLRPHAPVCVSR